MKYQREVEFARRMAAAAGANAQHIRKQGINAEAKADASPVTVADRDNERLLREAIESEFPDDGILGEEGSSKAGTSGRCWIVDPIDGTRDFVRGNRFWCVLIALESGGETLVGVAHFPLLEETYWAVIGEGAYLHSERLRASARTAVGECTFHASGLQLAEARPHLPTVVELMQRSWSVRAYGGALDACLVAAGKVDIWFEPKVASWDVAGLRLIIEEAGGAFFALDGSRGFDRGSAFGCAPGLAGEVRRVFRVPNPVPG
ncbi:MAG TPA: inositol monophosphatase [Bryobacteraceae bacterium]|nr:inositol monophosphatase [Bryobacteraceae bacterium]